MIMDRTLCRNVRLKKTGGDGHHQLIRGSSPGGNHYSGGKEWDELSSEEKSCRAVRWKPAGMVDSVDVDVGKVVVEYLKSTGSTTTPLSSS